MSTPVLKNWARELASGLVSQNQLVSRGLMGELPSEAFEALKNNFDVRVPLAFAQTAALNSNSPSNLHPALKAQVIPSSQELIFFPEELDDPIGDEPHSPIEGVTRRYPDRALLKLTYQCAMYCRFCFRRYKVSEPDFNLDVVKMQAALDFLEQTTDLWEVILTGGDPLVLTDKALQGPLERLAAMPHIQVLRIHTRIPTALPSRITPELIALLKATGKTVWVVAHINSAQELTPEASAALARLIDAGIPVLSQSVLLKGVNATSADLTALFKGLIARRVKPYYLHYPDLAKGTQHFRVPLEDAIALVASLRGQISGTCVPQLVVDLPGGHGKIAIEPQWAKFLGNGNWEFKSPLHGGTLQVHYPTTL